MRSSRVLRAKLPNGEIVHLRTPGCEPVGEVGAREELATLIASSQVENSRLLETLCDVVRVIFPGARRGETEANLDACSSSYRPDLLVEFESEKEIGLVELERTSMRPGDVRQALLQVQRYAVAVMSDDYRIVRTYVIVGEDGSESVGEFDPEVPGAPPTTILTWADVAARLTVTTESEHDNSVYTIILVEIATGARRLLRALAAHPELLSGVNDLRFEELVATLLFDLGFEEVELTPARADQGRDVIVTRRNPANGIREVYLFECKHWVSEKKVHTKIAAKLLDVLERDDATGAILLSSSGFGPRLLEQEAAYTRKGLRLRTEQHLRSWVSAWERYYGSVLISPLDPFELMGEK